MLVELAEVAPILRCPGCRGALTNHGETFACPDPDCACADRPFPIADGKPALIDFATSVIDRGEMERNAAPRERRAQSRAKQLVRRHFLPSNPRAGSNAEAFLQALPSQGAAPLILIVGGGTIGEGAGDLYQRADLRTISVDIYPSQCVQLLADAHALPFADSQFDGVWIQAVLEHVLTPGEVVEEICRVLKPGGVVYAETPFLQGVHEGAYDFTRFTESGHRWLFRKFDRLGSGALMGPFARLVDALGGAARALTGSAKAALALQLAFFWLNALDRLVPARRQIDHASAVWFLGRKSGGAIGPKEAIAHYRLVRADRRS